MKYKGIALVGVVLTGGLMLLAYHAGANTNHLSAEDTNFNHLLADHHNRSLTQIMRDGAVDKVGKWIENHERRLVALAAEGVSGYSALNTDQINFNKYKSTAHGNKLTQEMRDRMTAMLTNVATNHEMRLRMLEKPKQVKQYTCRGNYQDGGRTRYYRLREGPGCWKYEDRGSWDSYDMGVCKSDADGNYLIGYIGDQGFISASEFCTYENGEWKNCREYSKGSDYGYDQEEYIPIMKSCSSFNEDTCKAKTGCSRVEKK